MNLQNIQHKGLTHERWNNFSLLQQLAHIGSEVERTIIWKEKGDLEYSKMALFRALELIDLTVADPKNKKRLKEVLRSREALVDHFMYDNDYNTTGQQWRDYFYQFGYAAAMERGR